MVKLFPEGTRERFLDLVCAGLSVQAAAARVGAVHTTGSNWWQQSGGMALNNSRRGGLADPVADPGEVGGRALTLDQRGMIQMGRRTGMSYAEIGAEIGRDKSVVWREVKRNTSPDGVYYASVAHTKAHHVNVGRILTPYRR